MNIILKGLKIATQTKLLTSFHAKYEKISNLSLELLSCLESSWYFLSSHLSVWYTKIVTWSFKKSNCVRNINPNDKLGPFQVNMHLENMLKIVLLHFLKIIDWKRKLILKVIF